MAVMCEQSLLIEGHGARCGQLRRNGVAISHNRRELSADLLVCRIADVILARGKPADGKYSRLGGLHNDDISPVPFPECYVFQLAPIGLRVDPLRPKTNITEVWRQAAGAFRHS